MYTSNNNLSSVFHSLDAGDGGAPGAAALWQFSVFIWESLGRGASVSQRAFPGATLSHSDGFYASSPRLDKRPLTLRCSAVQTGSLYLLML